MFIIVFAVIPEIEWKKKESKQQIGRLREGACLQIIREQINVVRASDCHYLGRNSPEFYPWILRHSGI